MVERVARVLKEHFAGGWAMGEPDCIPAAKAAIQAMREPTQEMLLAVDSIGREKMADGYTAMIDAALKSG